MRILKPVFIIFAIFAMATPSFAAEKPSKEEVRTFVETLSNEVIEVLKANEDNLVNRQKGFEEIFRKAGDVPKIARFVAGKAWKLSEDKDLKKDYVETYRQYMAFTYASRITEYHDQQVKVGRIADIGRNGFLVYTKLIDPNMANDMQIIWQLSYKDNALKIMDLRVENISMSLTQRQEFNGYLEKNWHDLAALNNMLKKRLENLHKK